MKLDDLITVRNIKHARDLSDSGTSVGFLDDSLYRVSLHVSHDFINQDPRLLEEWVLLSKRAIYHRVYSGVEAKLYELERAIYYTVPPSTREGLLDLVLAVRKEMEADPKTPINIL